LGTAIEQKEEGRVANSRFRDAAYLSAGERRILALASQGLTDKEISREIGLCVSTIRTYWTRLRLKLGVVNRAQAIAQAIEKEVADEQLIVEARVKAMHVILNARGIGLWEWDTIDDKVLADDVCARIFRTGGGGSKCSLEDFVASMPSSDRDHLLNHLQDQGKRPSESVTHRIRHGSGIVLARTRVMRIPGVNRVAICTTEAVSAP
jgi:DNA-binding CsgD family transcriptional regulator